MVGLAALGLLDHASRQGASGGVADIARSCCRLAGASDTSWRPRPIATLHPARPADRLVAFTPDELNRAARQALLASNFQARVREFEFKWRTEASVGYLIEASIGVSARWGRINTPWWSFTPERADYVAQPAPVIGTSVGESPRERYAWAGIKVRRRLYNVFLQGQFRDSAVEFSSQAIEPLVVEAWVGMTWQISPVFRLSYVARYQMLS